MEPLPSSPVSGNTESLLREKELPQNWLQASLFSSVHWFRMLAKEMHWSFVYGIVAVNGISQGLGGAVFRVASDYYWKDVQQAQPSAAQVYQGSAGVAIADVTIDACVAQNSINHPSLAADMQSLCGFSSSIGGLIGFSISGLLMHAIGSKGVLGLLSIPAALVFSVGMVLKELHVPNFPYRQIFQKLLQANRTMWATLKCSQVWRPCVFMFTSLALNLNIQEGLFYWELLASFIPSDRFTGILDLILVLRLNLRFGMPDRLFAVLDESVSQMIGRIRWMPLLVLSSKLCPCGIEGTFFALLMSIDHAGMLTSSWGGGFLLQVLKVSRSEFSNLWVAILIRSLLRVVPLALLYLVPKSNQHSIIIPVDAFMKKEIPEALEAGGDDVEQPSLHEDT
ncbi:putative folate-biopterin transporter 2 [Cocos nucifera]|uniref:Putative folate-biopterin transporter 2 n=1 Tax=Cocos nucifera TaxID=13894 RepID=A0A8K0IQH4_COCNU|nr:putative folate-biopterin transporter 2 [Cocos nucifera]